MYEQVLSHDSCGTVLQNFRSEHDSWMSIGFLL